MQLYRQVQLLNTELCTSSAGTIAGIFLLTCLIGHALVIVTFAKLYQEMPIPMTTVVLYYLVALLALELVLVRDMGTVKEMSRNLVKGWMGQVKRRHRRPIKCLMPFGIQFGSEIQKTTALTYLLLVSKSAKYLIIIG